MGCIRISAFVGFLFPSNFPDCPALDVSSVSRVHRRADSAIECAISSLLAAADRWCAYLFRRFAIAKQLIHDDGSVIRARYGSNNVDHDTHLGPTDPF